MYPGDLSFRRCRKPLQVRLGTRQRVKQELLRFLQPQTVIHSRHRFGYQNVCRKADQRSVPSGPPPIGSPSDVREQARPIEVAMIVECQLVPNDDDVVTGVTVGRSNPNRLESAFWIGLQERIGQDVACPAREEHALWQGPLFIGSRLPPFVRSLYTPESPAVLAVNDCLAERC